MLEAVKTKTEVERKADETRKIKEDQTETIRKDLLKIRHDIRKLQVQESINEFLLEAIRECHDNARIVKCFMNGYITGHEMIHSLNNISPTLRYQLAMLLLEQAEHKLYQ
jgi:hypothetical protein